MNGNSSFLQSGIEHPNDHDVLSGRGNFVNYHAGNEHFRALVRKHKIAYVACPKPQKGKFSRIIVDEIRNREPSGRFLKQDNATKMWYDIGDKKALDKTRQALREGAPDLLKDIDPEDEEHEGGVPHGAHSIHQQQGFVDASVFGGSNAPNFPCVNHALLSGTQSPSLVQSGGMPLSGVPSCEGGISQLQRAQLQMNRVVPGMLHMPAGTTQIGALRGSGGGLGDLASAIQGVEASMGGQLPADHYGVNQFEPTPINPHAQIRVAQSDRDRPAPAPQMRGIQRDNSLTFENIFTKENLLQVGKTSTAKRTMEGSSQHLSAMSFSIGDMTDASNLSAVFEDSMRISDDAATATLETKSKGTISDRRKPNAAYSNANIDMSAASLGSMGLEHSMMHMSFKSGFDEDSTKDGR